VGKGRVQESGVRIKVISFPPTAFCLLQTAYCLLYLELAGLPAHTAVDDKVPPLLERKKHWKS